MSEREIFTAARDIADPAARAAYLDAACAGDAALRARVEALLRADARPDSLLDVPAVAPPEPGSAPTRAFRARRGGAPGDGPTRTHGEGDRRHRRRAGLPGAGRAAGLARPRSGTTRCSRCSAAAGSASCSAPSTTCSSGSSR